jgi:translocation and assembly module TamA
MPAFSRHLLRGAVALAFAAIPLGSFAADPQAYSVDLQATGQDALDTALRDSSNLIGLREKAPVGPFALVSRARDDQTRLETALNSYGYYAGKVTIRVAGRSLDDPGLPAALDAATGSVPVAITITTGPVFHLRRVELTGEPDRVAQDALKLRPGDPAVAADVLAAQSRMLDALRNDGHALAKVDTPIARLEPAAEALDVSYAVHPGPRVNLGPITITGEQRVDESYIRRRLLIHQGEQFSPDRIERAREDLAGTGVFSTVRIQAPDQLDPAGQLPLTVTVLERPRHVVGLNAAYSTDLGFTAGVTWADRNLFGQAERLELGAAVTQLGGSSSLGAGYNLTATFTKPDVIVRDQDLIFSLQAIKENLEAYDRTAELGGVTLRRKLSETWNVSAGLQLEQARITQEGVTRDYTLLQFPLTVRYDSTGKEGLLEPTHGIRASATVTPTASLAGAGSDFVLLQTTGSTYINLGAPGRSVLALRATLASIQGATTFQVPPDQRLYAGGSATVRGYKYQFVGPKFPDGRPTGGTSLAAFTVEYRQRILQSFGAAVFVDAGQVDTSSNPFGGNLRAGAGAGARYYTPIGPIRLDVAVPLNRQHGDDTLEVYIGIGQAF